MAAFVDPSNPWPHKTSNVTCNICEDVTDANWESEEDDLLVCINPKCKRRYTPICRGCMGQTHRKSGKHNLNDDAKNFMDLKEWYKLSRIKKCDPDHTAVTAFKSVVKSGVVNSLGQGAAYAVADKAVLAVIREIPKNISKDTLKKYAGDVITQIGKSNATGKALLKSMAKSQALVSGIMFALEVGWNLVQYSYNESIDYHELMRRNKKAAVAHTSGFVCSMVGGGIGMLFGPWGAVAGAALGGFIGDLTARKVFDSKSPNDRKKQIKTALIRFHYPPNDLETVLKDRNNFNLQELQDRYHLKAPYNHPDGILRGMGKTEEELKQQWAEFYACYNVLLVLCKERDAKK